MKGASIVFLAFLSFPQAQAQSMATRDALIRSYENCVLTVSLGIRGEKHMVAEQAFSVCQTEEEALRAWFALVQVAPDISNSFVTRLKLSMKRTILADPIVR